MRQRGFTLMEMLLVLVLVAIVASLVAPMVTRSVDRAREATLKENLFILRKAIDDYYADAGAYPDELKTLVEKRYIRNIPVDPITEKKDWKLVRTGEEGEEGEEGGIIDVKSSSNKPSAGGKPYNEW